MWLLSNPNSIIAKKTKKKYYFGHLLNNFPLKAHEASNTLSKKDPYSSASFFPVDHKGTFEHGLTGWKKYFY